MSEILLYHGSLYTSGTVQASVIAVLLLKL